MATSALATFASRVGRFSLILGIGLVLQLLLGLATAIFLTHHLNPAEYGHLALYLLVSVLVMTLGSLGTLQGTMRVIFGHGGEEGVEDVPADATRPKTAVKDVDVRAALATGAAITFVLTSVVAAPIIVLAGPISNLLGGIDRGSELVVIGAITGVVSALWRILSMFLRYAARPYAYTVSQTSRFVLTLAFTVVLVLNGEGIRGAVLALLFASTGALLFTLLFLRRDIRPRLSAAVLAPIWRAGRIWIPVSISFFVVLTMDVYVLSLFKPASEVGVYRLGTSLARVSAYAVSAFIYAWGPLLTSPLRVAVDREQGRGRLAGLMVSIYPAAAASVVIVIGVLGDVVVRVAPKSFGSAAGLIPVLALPPLARGLFMTTYAFSNFPRKRGWFIGLAASAMVVFVGLSVALVPPLGSYGIGLAATGGFLLPALAMLTLSQRGPQPMPLDLHRLLLAPAVAAGLLLGELALDPGVGPAGLAIKAGVILAFFGLLLITGVIPRSALRLLARPLGVLRHGQLSRRELTRRVRALPPRDSLLVADLLRRGTAPGTAPPTEQEILRLERFTVVTRGVADIHAPVALDWQAARWALFSGPAGERGVLGDELIAGGADPLALDLLDQTVSQLRRIPRRYWRRD
jgi:O-antigen/teichoic acid export membrane protein